MKDKKENCVKLNIYVECDKCIKYGGKDQCDLGCKHEEDETCIEINVYVECDKKKY